MSGRQAALSHPDGDPGAVVDHLSGQLQQRRRWQGPGWRKQTAAMLCDVLARTLRPVRCPVLNVFGHSNMGHATPGERGLDGLIDHIVDVGWSHHPLVIHRYIYEELIEVDVLLLMRANQIMECMARDG